VTVEDLHLSFLLILVAVSGIGMTFNIAPLHTLSGDITGAARRGNAIGLISTGQRAVAAAGALGSGFIIGTAGPAWSFVFSAAAYLVAAFAYRRVREPSTRVRGANSRFLSETVEGFRVVLRVPMVAILLGLMVVVEIFGFAYVALLPALAERVLHTGATGLGGLSSAASIGSVIATLFLAAFADRTRHGWLFIAAFATFGVLLLALGASRTYALSLLTAAGIGACAALVDALEWIMLQASVDDRLRGRALGAWNVAIGFGWIGPLILGAVGDAASIPAAFTLAGMILLATAATMLVAFPRLRAA